MKIKASRFRFNNTKLLLDIQIPSHSALLNSVTFNMETLSYWQLEALEVIKKQKDGLIWIFDFGRESGMTYFGNYICSVEGFQKVPTREFTVNPSNIYGIPHK